MNNRNFLYLLLLLAVAFTYVPMKAVTSQAGEPSLQASRDLEPSDLGAQLNLLRHEVDMHKVDTTMLLFGQQHGAKVRIERVLYPANTPDRTMIPGYLFTPAAGIPKAEKRPGLLIVHGGFHTCFEWRYFNIVAGAVEQGYAVMFPEYRGSSGYGESHFSGDYGTTDVADVLAAADYLATKEFVDPARLGLFGHSRGGMITVRLLQQHPKRFQAAVQVCALLDFVAYMSYKPDSRRRQVAEDKGFGGKLPSENLPPYIEVSPINFVPDIQTPLLCLGIAGDKLVPNILNTQRLIDLLRAHNKVFDSHIYDNAPGGHSFLFADSAEARDCLQRSHAWLARYLKR